jgi:hypothetical protein
VNLATNRSELRRLTTINNLEKLFRAAAVSQGVNNDPINAQICLEPSSAEFLNSTYTLAQGHQSKNNDFRTFCSYAVPEYLASEQDALDCVISQEGRLQHYLDSDPAIPHHSLPTNFYRSYLDDNESNSQILYAAARYGTSLTIRHSKDNEGTVGFISSNLRNHTIGHLFQNLLIDLQNQGIQVVFIDAKNNRPRDNVNSTIRESVYKSIDLSGDLEEDRDSICKLKLKILVSLDTQLNSYVETLLAHRLAPIQAATWGHPCTTGMPSFNAFLSSNNLETPQSSDLYTEQLFKSDNIFCTLNSSKKVTPFTRASLGIPEDANLYGCLQTLYKVHPLMDQVFKDILSGDPKALICLIANPPRLAKHISYRLLQSMGPMHNRVLFFSPTSPVNYRRLAAAMNVSIDSQPFGGGFTTIESLSANVPVVTCDGTNLKSRISSTIAKEMDWQHMVVPQISDLSGAAIKSATGRGKDDSYRIEGIQELQFANIIRLLLRSDPDDLRPRHRLNPNEKISSPKTDFSQSPISEPLIRGFLEVRKTEFALAANNCGLESPAKGRSLRFLQLFCSKLSDSETISLFKNPQKHNVQCSPKLFSKILNGHAL